MGVKPGLLKTQPIRSFRSKCPTLHGRPENSDAGSRTIEPRLRRFQGHEHLATRPLHAVRRLARMHSQSLYQMDADARFVRVHEPEPEPAPRFALIGTRQHIGQLRGVREPSTP